MQHDRDILSELFDSPAKVKSLKLFLRNPEQVFTLKAGAEKIRIPRNDFAKLVKRFMHMGLVRSHDVKSQKKTGKGKVTATKEVVFAVDPKFPFYDELRGLVTKSSPTTWDKKLPVFAKLGRIKLAVVAGSLVNDEKGRVDVLLVGDHINTKSSAAFMRGLEAEVGKELRYMTLALEEFTYRFSMYDNFLRDILERPHKKLINKIKNIVGDDNPGLSKVFHG